MLCICLPQINEATAGLGAPLPAIEVPPLPAGAADLAASASAAAAINAAMEAAASGALDAMLALSLPPFSIEAVLALEAMAQVGGAMGIEMMSPSANMDLSLAAGALNIAAPALGEMGGALSATLEPMGGLPMALSINAAIESSLGINLAMPGAAAALEASLAAAIEAAASLSASLGASGAMELAANLGLAARAVNAAIALGMEPSALPEFAASVEASANLEVPPLEMSAGEMGEVSAGLGDFGLVSAAAEGAPLSASMPAIEAGAASLAANMDAAISATAGMSADLSANAAASAELAAALSAAADAPMGAAAGLGGMDLGGLPSMGDMSIAATLAQSFEAAMGMPMLSGAPCPNIFCVAGR